MRRSPRAVQITDAAPSAADERHHRERRYLAMMGIRALCLVLITVLVRQHAPLLVVWVPILVFGVLVVPWLAVILANGGSSRRSRRAAMRPAADPPTRALTQAETDVHPVIDVDP